MSNLHPAGASNGVPDGITCQDCGTMEDKQIDETDRNHRVWLPHGWTPLRAARFCVPYVVAVGGWFLFAYADVGWLIFIIFAYIYGTLTVFWMMSNPWEQDNNETTNFVTMVWWAGPIAAAIAGASTALIGGLIFFAIAGLILGVEYLWSLI